MPATTTLTLHTLLSPETVRVNLPGREKEDVLQRVVALLEGRPDVRDLAKVQADVLAREAKMTTGVGLGLALPHAKTDAVTDTLAAFAVTAGPIDFDAMDGQPVRLVFLLVGPEQERIRHIKLLSRVSRLMNRDAFRKQLLHAPDAAAVLRLFAEAEAEL